MAHSWERRVLCGWARGEVTPEAGRQSQLTLDGEDSHNPEATENSGRTVDSRAV